MIAISILAQYHFGSWMTVMGPRFNQQSSHIGQLHNQEDMLTNATPVMGC